jgi:oxygen-independent coproporphyrinogen-3 oxidase
MDDRSLGVYLHVPFCERICPYCDFAVVRSRRLAPAAEQTYVDALLAELAMRSKALAGRSLASIYLGGGTPSLLRPESVARLVAAVRAAFPEGEAVEVTLEANPSTTDQERLPGFRAAGVNRLSLGVQSFDDACLKRLGRAHRAAESRRAIAAARAAGFDDLALDLIFAVPGQTREALGRDLDEALAFEPEHVSAYELTVEAGTPFALGVRRGQLRLPAEEESAGMFEQVEERLEAADLRRYEISSFARPGREALHNRRYWERRAVLGLGMGAWSTAPPGPSAPFGARRSNVRDLHAYLERIARGESPDAGPAERLTAATARGEAIFLALRTRWGVDAERFAEEFGASPRGFFGEAIEALVDAGFLTEDARGDLRLTASGRLVSDSVFERFVEPEATR